MTEIEPKIGKPAGTRDVAVLPSADVMSQAVVRALILSSDDAILVTDLHHKSIACNSRFGEYFLVNPDDAVRMGVEELRAVVLPRLHDPEAWRAQLAQIYDRPDETHEDELELLPPRPMILRRRTGPVRTLEGQIIGRIWTFVDITAEKRREAMREIIAEFGTLHDPQPRSVCRHAVSRLSGFYGGSSVLALESENWGVLASGEKSEFIVGSEFDPAVWDDLRQKPEFVHLAGDVASRVADQFGVVSPRVRRCLGVRVNQSSGWLMLFDESDASDVEDDRHFLQLVKVRIEAELDRDRMIEERIAAERDTLERQRRDLETTHKVLSAMNSAFEVATRSTTIGEFVDKQVSILRGVLGFDSTAILIRDSKQELLSGSVLPAGEKSPHPITVDLAADTSLFVKLRAHECDTSARISFEHRPQDSLASSLGSAYVLSAFLKLDTEVAAILALGSDSAQHTDSAHYSTHLEAIVDQVYLAVASQILYQRLSSTHYELQATQDRLVQAEKLSAVGTLAAGTAHDIRNIISSLVLETAPGAQSAEDALAAVRSQIGRFSLLSHRLLSYAKPRLLTRERYRIEDLIERALELTGGHLRAAGVNVKREISEDLPPISVDVGQCEHLFVNLILNANDAMHPRGGCLSVTANRGGEEIVVTVGDTGQGMSEEQLTKLFQPFVSSKTDGFGLGLFSCKRIADEHGWSILAESKLGEGTTFHIRIPITKQENGE